jgi:ABC-type multidrug transport system fused ATPase/permease subunit
MDRKLIAIIFLIILAIITIIVYIAVTPVLSLANLMTLIVLFSIIIIMIIIYWLEHISRIRPDIYKIQKEVEVRLKQHYNRIRSIEIYTHGDKKKFASTNLEYAGYIFSVNLYNPTSGTSSPELWRVIYDIEGRCIINENRIRKTVGSRELIDVWGDWDPMKQKKTMQKEYHEKENLNVRVGDQTGENGQHQRSSMNQEDDDGGE